LPQETREAQNMINFLNETLRQIFMGTVTEIESAAQVSFEFPDEDFRSQVKTNGKTMLNVCLVELKENRTASQETIWPAADPNTSQRRIDCHYLISAWSPATKSVEPTLDEHALLYKALAALMSAEPLSPGKVFGATRPPSNFPRSFLNSSLPTMVLPVEPYGKTGEFWNATRSVHWKPTIHLVVTLPVLPEPAT
jgi:hypothetical protein